MVTEVKEERKFRRMTDLEQGRASVSTIEEKTSKQKAEKRERFGIWFERASRDGGGAKRIPATANSKETDLKKRHDTFNPVYEPCKAPVKDETGAYNGRCMWEATDDEMKSREKEWKRAINNKKLDKNISLKQYTIMKHGVDKHFEWWWDEANALFVSLYGRHMAQVKQNGVKLPPAFDEVIFPDWMELI